MDAIRAWNYEPGGAPWMPLIALGRQLVRRPYEFLAFEPNGPYDTLNGLTAAIAVLSIPFVWRRFGAPYGIHILVNLWLPLSSGEFEGLGRYCAVLFPFFLWLGSFRSELFRDLVLFSSVALYVVCVSMFVTLHPTLLRRTPTLVFPPSRRIAIGKALAGLPDYLCVGRHPFDCGLAPWPAAA